MPITTNTTTNPFAAIVDSMRPDWNVQGKTRAINGAKFQGKNHELQINVQDNVGKIELEIGLGDILVKTYDREGKKLDTTKIDKFKLRHFPNNVTSTDYRYTQIIIDGGKNYEVTANKSKDNSYDNTQVILGDKQQGRIKANGNVFNGNLEILNLSAEKLSAAHYLRDLRHLASA